MAQSRCSSSVRRIWSWAPASSAATSLESSSWRRATSGSLRGGLPGGPLDSQRLLDLAGDALAVGAAAGGRHHVLDRLAHVARGLGAGLGDRAGHQRVELGVGELRGEVALDDRRLVGLGLGEVTALGLAIGGLRLAAALALPAQHGELVAGAL